MRTELNVQHQLGGRLCASNHARNPRARMRPRADEVKIRNHIVAVVGAEPGALPEDRLETERAAEGCGQVAAEIGGRVVETCYEIGDRKRGVWGQRGSVGVDLGGTSICKK